MGGGEWRRVAGALALVAALAVSYFYAESRGRAARCLGVCVRVVDSAQLGFLTPGRVAAHLRAGVGDVQGLPLGAIDTHQLERLLADIPSLGRAEAYVDCRGVVNVVVEQRHPLFRVMGRSGASCYVDAEGRPFPLDRTYAAHALVVSGRIEVPALGVRLTDSISSAEGALWGQLYALARFIDGQPEWKSLIAQIYVASPRRVELVPRVGGFIINLGRLEDIPYKFDKLRSIYRATLPGQGLGVYSVVDLAYSDQVVCVRRGDS